jgi:hypothetical protein
MRAALLSEKPGPNLATTAGRKAVTAASLEPRLSVSHVSTPRWAGGD